MPKKKPQKIVFFIPLPKLNKKEFKQHTKLGKKTKLKLNDLEFTYDPEHNEEGKDPFTAYNNDMKDMQHKSSIHINTLQKSFNRRNRMTNANETVKFVDFTLPKTEEQLRTAENTIKNLKPDDILFINAHGNADVMGISVMELDEKLLASNLQKLGLPKRPPLIALWSCYSAQDTEENLAPFAQRLRNELKALGYKEVETVGSIVRITSSLEEGTHYTNKDNEKIDSKDALKFFFTPEKKDSSNVELEEINKGSVTPLIEKAKARLFYSTEKESPTIMKDLFASTSQKEEIDALEEGTELIDTKRKNSSQT